MHRIQSAPLRSLDASRPSYLLFRLLPLSTTSHFPAISKSIFARLIAWALFETPLRTIGIRNTEQNFVHVYDNVTKLLLSSTNSHASRISNEFRNQILKVTPFLYYFILYNNNIVIVYFYEQTGKFRKSDISPR